MPRLSMRTSLPRIAVLLAAGLWLAACSSSKKDDYVERPAEEFYNIGLDALLAGEYEVAAKNFDEVERQHPYSSWAPRAELLAAFSLYQANKYDEAVAALDRFIQLNPGSDEIGYAYYLKAICYYEQISDVRRDQEMTREALSALQEVVRRFPDSAYARDAALKIDLARDQLAGQEMVVGRFYEQQGEYLAAINRFQTVVRDYQTTAHTPEALHRLVESYLALGLKDEAEATGAVLGYNYPGSSWYVDTYRLLTGVDLRPQAHEGSWISSVWHSVF